MLSVAADLAAALRDQPAVEEATVWAAVVSAVEVVVGAAAAGAAAEVGDKQPRKDYQRERKPV
jgi:hypothetical protein